MDWLEAMVLGIIQGLTEFLPISSTGHLYLGRHLFGLDDGGLFLDTVLHLGTLIAVLMVYRREVAAVIREPFSRMAKLLVVGTIPTVIIGLSFKDVFEEISETGVTIGWEFLVTGAVLWMADRWKQRGHKSLEKISYTDAIVVGTFQGTAILPAVSRSGMTIAAALYRRIDKETAAYFSFFLSIPAIAGALLFQLVDLATGRTYTLPLSSLMMATVMSTLFGYLAVRWMIRLLQRGSLRPFAVYVWGLGLLVLLFQWSGQF
ncbi:MAG: undecaprenyl-diphosphate phosphatase [Firmicutes bacterium]|uniref:Undecaprenyl-diphosphatase n=1 Tax=Melghirimyces thermohalophilus TaxID=1236220 RepID=A0A1G6K9Z1_9BACL|nr:undecaprenyl-diphosphate phosphatase [Melghirimyces thermohalophilus]MDA8354099.1 undecaprenyl-diphosphate phosphatase [Bacillota bacterium]SDC27889.1 undecaprenyl-diphosphatase [Melghirimyces thermohalophilus]